MSAVCVNSCGCGFSSPLKTVRNRIQDSVHFDIDEHDSVLSPHFDKAFLNRLGPARFRHRRRGKYKMVSGTGKCYSRLTTANTWPANQSKIAGCSSAAAWDRSAL